MISIIAEDSMQQSAEIIVDVIVANWASKDWAKCVSEFESGWIEWKYNFKLGDNKSWCSRIRVEIDMWERIRFRRAFKLLRSLLKSWESLRLTLNCGLNIFCKFVYVMQKAKIYNW